MQDSDIRPNRRAFLAGASTVLAAAAVTESAAAQKLVPPRPAAPAMAHGPWNLSWVDRLTHARHKAVFDSTEVANGTALFNAFFCLRDYNAVYDVPDAEMGVVVVVRHFALPIVFGDASWAQFKLGEMTKIKDPATGQDIVRNPFAHVQPGDKIMQEPGAGIDALIDRGVTVLCCNEALTRMADMMGKSVNLSGADTRKALIASMIPGVLLVPSGIFGLTRASEAGCHYIRSS